MAATIGKWDTIESVNVLREYLRIPSVHPDIDYSGCVDFLKKQAASMDLPILVIELAPKKPAVVITWWGQRPELPSIILNSHMDVVPVYEEHWSHPPFAGHVTEDGWIYGRGTQDMKGVGIQQLEAVRSLKNAGVKLLRTVHLTYVCDEEIGSYEGMRKFVEAKEFQDLNAGFALDESMPSWQDDIIVFYGERATIQFKIICRGEPGHGALLPSGSAGVKLQFMINKLMDLRADEKRKMDSGVWIGKITSVNMTMIEGGVQVNVLPEMLSVTFDVRMAPHVDHQQFEDQILTWCKEAGPDVDCEFLQRNPVVKNTKIDESNPFWTALKQATDDIGQKLVTLICPGATDARFLRQKGIPSLGFSPMINTRQLLHAHDERIHVDEYLRGISVMEKVLTAVANVL